MSDMSKTYRYLLRAVYQEQVTCSYHCDPDDEPDPPIENKSHFQRNWVGVSPIVR